jgi:hypothetical protein
MNHLLWSSKHSSLSPHVRKASPKSRRTSTSVLSPTHWHLLPTSHSFEGISKPVLSLLPLLKRRSKILTTTFPPSKHPAENTFYASFEPSVVCEALSCTGLRFNFSRTITHKAELSWLGDPYTRHCIDCRSTKKRIPANYPISRGRITTNNTRSAELRVFYHHHQCTLI